MMNSGNWYSCGDGEFANNTHPTYNEGDLVKLSNVKSPSMNVIRTGIVEHVDDVVETDTCPFFRYLVECAWFTDVGEYRTATIPENALELVK